MDNNFIGPLEPNDSISEEELQIVKAASNQVSHVIPNWGPASDYSDWKEAENFAKYKSIGNPPKDWKQFLSGLQDCAADFKVYDRRSEAYLIDSDDGASKNVYGIRNQLVEIAVIKTLLQSDTFFVTLAWWRKYPLPKNKHWELFQDFANGFHYWVNENWKTDLVWSAKKPQRQNENLIEEPILEQDQPADLITPVEPEKPLIIETPKSGGTEKSGYNTPDILKSKAGAKEAQRLMKEENVDQKTAINRAGITRRQFYYWKDR